MTSPFADTSKINLKILLDSKYKAEELIRKFVRKHLEKPEAIPDVSKLRMNNPNIRQQYFGLSMFYQQIYIPYFKNKLDREAEEWVARKWIREGKKPYYDRKLGDKVIKDDSPGFRTEVRKHIEKMEKIHAHYGRAVIEQTRLGSADNIIKGGSVESDLPSGLDLDEDSENDGDEPGTPDNGGGKKRFPRPGGGECPGEYCNFAKEDFYWRQGGSRDRWYCQNCWDGIFRKLEEGYIQRIKVLNKLTDIEKKDFIKQIRNSPSSQFENIWQQARVKNENKGGEEGGDDRDNETLATKIRKVIQEIEVELNKEPKITEKDEEWRTYIEASSTLIELKNRRKEVLDDIQRIRQPETELDKFVKEAIRQIKEELVKDPPVSSEELSNPDWESDIAKASSVSIANQIRSRVLSEIKIKRNQGSEKNSLNELLLRAHEQPNWNNFFKLFNILREIKKLRSSNFYLEKDSEVKAIENQLRTLNPEQFKEFIEQLLNYQAKDNGLNDSNTNEETKQAMNDWKANSTRENQVKVEEAICQNVADNKLIEICQEVETKLSKGKLSKKQAKKLIDKIQEIINKNDYQSLSYEKTKDKVDNFLKQLSENLDMKEPEEEQALLPKWFWPVAIASCLGVAVLSIALWIKGRSKEKSNRKVLTRHNKY